jgi:hypothetical protein
MRDYLLDLVEHTYGLGSIDLIKITGTATETVVNAVADDRSVVLEATFKTPNQEFIGTFGMPNLGKLNILLNLQEYRENAKLALSKRASNGEPESINFENAIGDFRNSYRFMTSELVTEKLKSTKFKGVKWDVEFTPTVSSILRMKMQAQANSEQGTFQAKTENGDLKFYFGDHSTHAGNFIFQPSVTGSLAKGWAWPVKTIISILDLSGDKIYRISDAGATMITVDSGLAVYNYILPAQSK